MPAVSLTNRLAFPACPEPVLSVVERRRVVHRCQRHCPEQALLYRIVGQHYPAFLNQSAALGAVLPKYVGREFDAYLKCGRLEHGFLRVRCTHCHHET